LPLTCSGEASAAFVCACVMSHDWTIAAGTSRRRARDGTLQGMGASPTALLLDALGTLVTLDPPAPLLCSELHRRFGIEVSEEDAGGAIAREIEYYRAHLDEGADEPSLAALRARCAEVLRAALPPSETLDALATADLTDALLASLRFSAFDDARGAILAARARGQRVAVASNWDVSLHAVLKQLGLAQLLDGIVTSAQAGARKPAPAVFMRALELAGGAGPGEAIHVGDSVEEDVAGARAAGIEAVLLCRDGRGAPAGVRTIRTLAELDRSPPSGCAGALRAPD
jgi:putative hydrolase of the HAD superfamily